jgi:hypothetical protein
LYLRLYIACWHYNPLYLSSGLLVDRRFIVYASTLLTLMLLNTLPVGTARGVKFATCRFPRLVTVAFAVVLAVRVVSPTVRLAASWLNSRRTTAIVLSGG